jgi:hypothetical protein
VLIEQGLLQFFPVLALSLFLDGHITWLLPSVSRYALYWVIFLLEVLSERWFYVDMRILILL